MKEIRYERKLQPEKVKCIQYHCYNYFIPRHEKPEDNYYCLECEGKFVRESKRLQRMVDNKYNLQKKDGRANNKIH